MSVRGDAEHRTPHPSHLDTPRNTCLPYLRWLSREHDGGLSIANPSPLPRATFDGAALHVRIHNLSYCGHVRIGCVVVERDSLRNEYGIWNGTEWNRWDAVHRPTLHWPLAVSYSFRKIPRVKSPWGKEKLWGYCLRSPQKVCPP